MNFVKDFWDVIWEVLGWFQFITFVDPWEEGIVVQAGTFRRTIGPGWWLHCPFEIDEITLMNVKPTALELEEQSAISADDVRVVARGVLMWGVFDVKKAFIDVEDPEDTLGDIAVGVVQEQIQEQDWEYIRTPEFRTDIKKAIQKEARKWGLSVPKFKFQDLTDAKSYRIFGGLKWLIITESHTTTRKRESLIRILIP